MTVFRELVLNAALLLSIVLILDLRDHWPLSALGRAGRLLQSLVIGLAVGAVALVILWAGVQPEPGVRMDTRSVLFVISGLFLGTIPTLIAGVIAAAARVFVVGGVAASTGVAIIVTSAGIGLLWRQQRYAQLATTRWYEFLLLGVIVQILLLVDIAVFAGEASERLLRAAVVSTSIIFPFMTMSLGVVAAGRVKRAKAFAIARLEGAALDASADATVITDTNGTIQWVNPAFTKLTGYTAAEAIGHNPREILNSGEHDQAFFAGMWGTLLAGNVWNGELVNRRKDGSHSVEEQTITPVKDENGRITNFIAIKRDISARRQLELQYHQAQKMEGIGRLAGGIAHDLNNLLTVINGTVELALPSAKNDPALRNDLIEIHRAGDRAASLTRQLLAFSRQQVMRPEVLDLNDVASELLKMLRRLIGENYSIHTEFARDLGRVRADVGQIEQVLMNLAVNARDAMPGGGTLRIATANAELDAEFASRHAMVTAGPYILLEISDDGTGMESAVLARLFEPFFTTKEAGKGTGLGLSTVYGIVKQSGGSIWVYSEIGMGTTFKIYLPRVDDPLPVRRASPERLLGGGNETVLVVEDEDAIRFVAARVLTMQGYTVINAPNGTDALAVAAAHPTKIDLLLTDMVMPGMTGPELASAMVATYPGMKVIFTSGYSADAVARQFGISDAAHFISKPYGLADLAREVRRVLDAR